MSRRSALSAFPMIRTPSGWQGHALQPKIGTADEARSELENAARRESDLPNLDIAGSSGSCCCQRLRVWSIVDRQANAWRWSALPLSLPLIFRITGRNFRLLHRLLTQIGRVFEIIKLVKVALLVVEAASEGLVIGTA